MPLSSLLPSRKALVSVGGFVGGVYMAQNFLKEKLEEAKEKIEEDRVSKENLKRRFSQTHHTTSYTILALLPELSSQILSEMDVETLTKELQALGRSGKTTTRAIGAPSPAALPASSSFPPLAPARAQSPSLASSIDVIQNSEAPSTSSSYASIAASAIEGRPEDQGNHARSTTEQSGGSGSDSLVHVVAPSPVHPAMSVSASVDSRLAASPPPGAMTESIMSSTASLVSNVPSEVSSTNPARSKAELWNEVKILTLTRTLTTLYSITLLSLLTTLQLSTLARYKYLLSVYEQEKEEHMREEMLRKFDISNIVMSGVVSGVGGVVGGLVSRGVGSVFGEGVRASLGLGSSGGGGKREEEGGLGGMQAMLEKLLEGGMLDGSLSEDEDDEEENYEDSLYAASFPQWSSSHSAKCQKEREERREKRKPIRKGRISPETENKYLTLSWWLLHVGCKDVGERVRRGVEDVFEGVSLKTKLSARDLHRLISDVRRRVEYEVTFEGVERRVDFLSSLLPSTPETIHHVLVQGGFTPPPPPSTLTSTAEAYKLNPEDPSSSRLGLAGSTRHSETDETMSSSQLSYSRQFDRRSEEDEDGRVDFDGVIRMDDVRSPISEVLGDGRRRESFGASRPSSLVVPNERYAHRPSPRVGSVHELSDPQPQSSSQRPLRLHNEHRQQQQLPDPYPHITNDPAFLHLVQETRQTISSVDFGIVLGACLEKSVEVLFEGLERNVFVEHSPPPPVPQVTSVGEVQLGAGMPSEAQGGKEEVRIRLAGLLPGLSRWSQLALNGMPNELVNSILATYEIPVLSAIVFGRFEEDVEYY